MKITGATSLLELQKLIKDENLDIKVHFTNSAACFRCIVTGPSAENEYEPVSAIGIGRDLGEAVSNAYEKYKETR